MKLSSETIDVLKNFSNINQNLLVKEGSKLRTMSTMKNILAEVDVSETMPREFGIYDKFILKDIIKEMSNTKNVNNNKKKSIILHNVDYLSNNHALDIFLYLSVSLLIG